MSQGEERIRPFGTPADIAAERWAAESPAFRAQREARLVYWEIAWPLIKYRMDHGLTQRELADRVGTSHPQISRIESGRYVTSLDTLHRIAHALDLKLVIGFERLSPEHESDRDVVAL
jgi:DNA-binding XRE family transcriptional regulator